MNKSTKNSIYFFIGSFTYLFCQWIMSVLVLRLSGSYEEAGVFGIAVSISNIFYIISSFSIRNYQVADIDCKFSPAEYFSHRIITCVISLVLLVVYLAFVRYSLYVTLSVISFMLVKIIESLIDAIHGAFQKDDEYNIIFMSLVIRGISIVIVFSVVEKLTKNLVVSLFFTAFISTCLAFVIDFKRFSADYKIIIKINNKSNYKLFVVCLPLFVNGLLSTLICNLPRIIGEKICGEEMFGFYASISAPTIIIHVVASSIFSPYITRLSILYKNKDKNYFKIIFLIQIAIVFVTVLAIIGFKLLGSWFLETVFNKELLKYEYLLLPSLLSAALNINTAFLSAVFTVIDRNCIMTIVATITAVCSVILSYLFINTNNLQGINYTLIISYCFELITSYFLALKISYKNIRKGR